MRVWYFFVVPLNQVPTSCHGFLLYRHQKNNLPQIVMTPSQPLYWRASHVSIPPHRHTHTHTHKHTHTHGHPLCVALIPHPSAHKGPAFCFSIGVLTSPTMCRSTHIGTSKPGGSGTMRQCLSLSLSLSLFLSLSRSLPLSRLFTFFTKCALNLHFSVDSSTHRHTKTHQMASVASVQDLRHIYIYIYIYT